MDIEERIYQSEFWGEAPELPDVFPAFSSQWEEIAQQVILEPETSEVSNVYPRPDFFQELELGFI